MNESVENAAGQRGIADLFFVGGKARNFGRRAVFRDLPLGVRANGSPTTPRAAAGVSGFGARRVSSYLPESKAPGCIALSTSLMIPCMSVKSKRPTGKRATYESGWLPME